MGFSIKFNCLLTKPICVVLFLLLLAIGMALLAFPSCAAALSLEGLQTGDLFPGIVWIVSCFVLYALFQQQVLKDFLCRQWMGGLFHLGMLCVIIGAGLTALFAHDEELFLAPAPTTEPMVFEDEWKPLSDVHNHPQMLPEWRQLQIAGRWMPIYPQTLGQLFVQDSQEVQLGDEVVALETFTIDRYSNGMPSQYRTTLRFPEGAYELSVNQPLRRKGRTYYQISYGNQMAMAIDRFDNPVTFRALQLDAQLQPKFDAMGQPLYTAPMMVAFPLFGTQLVVRTDPGVGITFVGYGLLILAAFLRAVREERQ